MTTFPLQPLGAGTLRRVYAMTLRYWYLLRGSWPRVLELAYWPSVQVLMWGFITQFFATHSTYLMQAFGVLLSGVLLWDVLFRAQLGVSVSFLEEMWSRNLGHLFVAPLRPGELVLAMMFMSVLRTLIGVLPATVLAIVAFEYSIYSMGLPLLAFFVNLLVMGWAVGLMICGLLLRFGLAAESLAWGIVFTLIPRVTDCDPCRCVQAPRRLRAAMALVLEIVDCSSQRYSRPPKGVMSHS